MCDPKPLPSRGCCANARSCDRSTERHSTDWGALALRRNTHAAAYSRMADMEWIAPAPSSRTFTARPSALTHDVQTVPQIARTLARARDIRVSGAPHPVCAGAKEHSTHSRFDCARGAISRAMKRLYPLTAFKEMDALNARSTGLPALSDRES